MRTTDEKKLEDIYDELTSLMTEGADLPDAPAFHGDFEGYTYKDYAKLDSFRKPTDRAAVASKKKEYIKTVLKPKVVEYMERNKGDGKVLHVKFDDRNPDHAIVQFMRFDDRADEYKLENEHIRDADIGEDFSKI